MLLPSASERKKCSCPQPECCVQFSALTLTETTLAKTVMSPRRTFSFTRLYTIQRKRHKWNHSVGEGQSIDFDIANDDRGQKGSGGTHPCREPVQGSLDATNSLCSHVANHRRLTLLQFSIRTLLHFHCFTVSVDGLVAFLRG